MMSEMRYGTAAWQRKMHSISELYVEEELMMYKPNYTGLAGSQSIYSVSSRINGLIHTLKDRRMKNV